jgi:hypothetical protein
MRHGHPRLANHFALAGVEDEGRDGRDLVTPHALRAPSEVEAPEVDPPLESRGQLLHVRAESRAGNAPVRVVVHHHGSTGAQDVPDEAAVHGLDHDPLGGPPGERRLTELAGCSGQPAGEREESNPELRGALSLVFTSHLSLT